VSWPAPPGADCAQAVADQGQQIVQSLAAGAHQHGDEGMLQSGYSLSKVGLPSQFPMGGLALNVGLLQDLHQKGQVLEQLAGVNILLHGTDRATTGVLKAQGLLEPSVVGFNAPAPAIQIGKKGCGERCGVQQ